MSTVLILGARVSKGRPGSVLAARLRHALPLIDVAEHTVLSGAGEAGVMAGWLRERGADPAKLRLEPRAASTNENLELAHALFPDTTCWTVVTSDFHVLRTRLWAWHLGIPVRVHGVRTPVSQRLSTLLRECLALPHSLLRVLWRRLRALG